MKRLAPRSVLHVGSSSLLGAVLVVVGGGCQALEPGSTPSAEPAQDGDGSAQGDTAGVHAAPISIPVAVDDDWGLIRAYSGDVRINGVACGELDPNTPGDEIVSVDRLGHMRLLKRSGTGFEEVPMGPIPAFGEGVSKQGATDDATGELVQVVVGDLAPSVPGDEIVAVGMRRGGEDDGGPGVIRAFARAGEDGGWIEFRSVTPALVHAVTIGDLRPGLPGPEFLCAGFFGEAYIGSLVIQGGTRVLAVDDSLGLVHEGNAKGACVVEGGFVLAGDDGRVTWYSRAEDESWSLQGAPQKGGALARIAAFPGGGVAVCSNDGIFNVRTAPGLGRTVGLFRTGNRLRGAVVADLDPTHPGAEAATAGYDGEITVIRFWPDIGATSDWIGGSGDDVAGTSHGAVARDTGKLHHLTTGTFSGLGASLVSCGYSGDILVVTHRASAR